MKNLPGRVCLRGGSGDQRGGPQDKGGSCGALGVGGHLGVVATKGRCCCRRA